jgi:cellulose synthase/poly-beta-1,6-N-acetylglucosamine synthase-like glycosyltransferase
MHSWLLQFFDYFNTIVLFYFVFTNGMYAVLMVCSMYSVNLHGKRVASTDYERVLDSPTTPPVALIIPAFNEEQAILQTVLSVMELRYPEKEIIVVDDGSTDATSARLINHFHLMEMDLIYREKVRATPPFAFYYNPKHPELLLVRKQNGGKPDALNVGLNIARSPYFCTVDADCLIEPEALLRLAMPIVDSPQPIMVSGGVVRILNGCTVRGGHVTEVDLPKTWIERCQVVEYIRTFLFGRPGWNFMGATFICSGAFCLLDRQAVIDAAGFSRDTVTEDIDIIANLHRLLRARKSKYRMVFTTDPVCWTESPKTLAMLARQRRRWQLGLMQTVMKHNDMIFSPRYGLMGMISMPFHAYIEAVGCVVEALGTVLIPFSFLVGAMPLWLFLLLVMLAVGYGTLLSIGSVLLEETTLRRYPKISHVLTLMLYAVLENFGYRQMLAFFRSQGVWQYFTGLKRWEIVLHEGGREPEATNA